jgi:citrate lyase subunit beta-like protein
MLDKTRGLTADCVAYDLEDSVTPGRKEDARSNIRRFLEQPKVSGIKECAVRINAVGSGYEAQDIAEIVRAPAGFPRAHG